MTFRLLRLTWKPEPGPGVRALRAGPRWCLSAPHTRRLILTLYVARPICVINQAGGCNWTHSVSCYLIRQHF